MVVVGVAACHDATAISRTDESTGAAIDSSGANDSGAASDSGASTSDVTTGGSAGSDASAEATSDSGAHDTSTGSSESQGDASTSGAVVETDDGAVDSTAAEPPTCGDPAPGQAIELAAVVAIDCAFAECMSTPEDDLAAQLAGPFTIVTELRFDARPWVRGVVFSRWDLSGDRSIEIGIDELQLPYVVTSADGAWMSSAATEVRVNQQLRMGETYELAVVLVPGERLAMYVDGVLVHEQLEVVDALHVGMAPLGLGRRSGGSTGDFVDAIGRVRIFDHALAAADIAALAVAHERCASPPALPPMQALTSGPDFHWFGYYDKFQFDPTDRWVLGMAVDFEDRAVTASDVVEIGMIDLQADNAWTTLGTSRAFNWQQGCMLQWLPGSATEVIWNYREGEGADAQFVARIVDVQSGEERVVPHPVYTVAPDGQSALRIDFERLADMRAGYGYEGIPDANAGVNAPEGVGVSAVDLVTGEEQLLFSLAEIAAIPDPLGPIDEAIHFFEMLAINPSGTRFFFMHRWFFGNGGAITRVFTANMDGSGLHLLTDNGMLSHITWLDDTHIVIYAPYHEGFALFEDQVGFVETVLPWWHDGHETFLPGNEWMLADTYTDLARFQHPFLYHLATDEVFALAHVHSPSIYGGGDRCDLHPRTSRDGRQVVIDSPHDGGRQMYLIEVGGILDGVE